MQQRNGPAAGGAAQNRLCGKPDLPAGAGFAAGDPFEQQPGSGPPDGFGLLVGGGELRPELFAERQIAETGDRQLLRHPDAEVVSHIQRVIRKIIVKTDQSFGPVRHFQQIADLLVVAVAGVGDFAQKTAVHRQTPAEHRIEKPGPPELTRENSTAPIFR